MGRRERLRWGGRGGRQQGRGGGAGKGQEWERKGRQGGWIRRSEVGRGRQEGGNG